MVPNEKDVHLNLLYIFCKYNLLYPCPFPKSKLNVYLKLEAEYQYLPNFPKFQNSSAYSLDHSLTSNRIGPIQAFSVHQKETSRQKVTKENTIHHRFSSIISMAICLARCKRFCFVFYCSLAKIYIIYNI